MKVHNSIRGKGKKGKGLQRPSRDWTRSSFSLRIEDSSPSTQTTSEESAHTEKTLEISTSMDSPGEKIGSSAGECLQSQRQESDEQEGVESVTRQLEYITLTP